MLHGDTDLIPRGAGTMGSRSLQTGGVAVYQAAGELVELAKQRAADLLEANVDDLEVVDGAVTVRGTDTGVTLAALAEKEPLQVDTVFDSGAPTFPFGAHVAVVEVDVESGKAVVDRIITVDDAGPVLNPLLARRASATAASPRASRRRCSRRCVYDDDGNPITSTFADYAFPSAAELPSFTLVDMATPTPLNPLGVKGIGEAGTIGATPGRAERGDRRRVAPRRPPHRHADRPAAGVGSHRTPPRRARVKVAMTVNGEETSADVEPRLLLAHYLREVLGLQATNIGCDTTSCGACTVLVDGESVKSCTVLAAQADGLSVTTSKGSPTRPGRSCTPCRPRSAPSTACSAGSAPPAW